MFDLMAARQEIIRDRPNLLELLIGKLSVCLRHDEKRIDQMSTLGWRVATWPSSPIIQLPMKAHPGQNEKPRNTAFSIASHIEKRLMDN
jgi:hypothetical protein